MTTAAQCRHCGSTLGLDCGDAEPDYDAAHCSAGCYRAAAEPTPTELAALAATCADLGITPYEEVVRQAREAGRTVEYQHALILRLEADLRRARATGKPHGVPSMDALEGRVVCPQCEGAQVVLGEVCCWCIGNGTVVAR